MEIIKLNLIPSGVNPTCHCSQYDNGRVIRIELFDGLTPYVLQSGDTVTLNVRKPDNTIVTTSLTATQGNTYVNLVTTEQICACVGYNLCDLTITNGETVIGTLNFIMQIERDVLADGIPSQSVIEDLDELVQEAVGDNYYTKTETNSLLNEKADNSNTYNKSEVDAALALKTNNSTTSALAQRVSKLENDTEIIYPPKTSFFEGINYFDPSKATLYTDRFINNNGLVWGTSNVDTLVFPVDPSTEYYLFIPNNNRGIIVESETSSFEIGTTYPILYSGGAVITPYHFTTSAATHYVAIYFYSGNYDYNNYKDDIVLNINQYYGDTTPFIPYQYLPKDLTNVLDQTKVLIFGDSITDTCNLTINSSKETTAYSWRNPSNSYVNAQGNTINYSMWAKILKESQPCKEIRNYALTGASYKTDTRTTGNERQNLQYQIDVALNDVDNPHGVFEIAHFEPDIVVFALGTNDGAPNDTYEDAMSKTVYKSDGVTIDVDATIAALDESKFCEAARKAFLRIKQAFPLAQIYCSLPIQRANNETNNCNLREYLKQIAQRCGCIIIDGCADSGITREFNNWNALGVYLKDGLHPNEKGQNMLARMIISSIKAHYLPFGNGFNQ